MLPAVCTPSGVVSGAADFQSAPLRPSAFFNQECFARYWCHLAGLYINTILQSVAWSTCLGNVAAGRWARRDNLFVARVSGWDYRAAAGVSRFFGWIKPREERAFLPTAWMLAAFLVRSGFLVRRRSCDRPRTSI